jgi:hypothetical protein
LVLLSSLLILFDPAALGGLPQALPLLAGAVMPTLRLAAVFIAVALSGAFLNRS